jgi:DNA-binding SARP family transcriptional activator
MDTASLQVQMFGQFSLSCDGREINDGDNRSRKVWLLLAYMIYCRNRSISQDELIGLFWGDDEGSANPVNALKTMFHRVRTMLNQLDPDAGHALIVRRNGSYCWNPDISFHFDVEDFESLCKAGATATQNDVRLASYMKALTLYAGDFLPKLASESWVVPISAYFHNLFVQTAAEAIGLLEDAGRLEDAISLCRHVLDVEPYDESIYQHLMRDLLDNGDQQGVISLYQTMSDLLFSNFGIMPSDEIKALYREAMHTTNEREVSLSLVREQLREGTSGNGALFCDYDFFKIIYHAEARAVARSGDAVHIGLLSVAGGNGQLSKRSLDICMDNLRDIVCAGLRKGDIAARCSISQYIVLLPQANYENSCMVMERLIKAFTRQYPHSPATLRFSVQPLDPNV